MCSFLNDFIKDLPREYTELHLFSDNCSAQNKNQTLCRFLLYLTDSGRFKTIHHFFPVRGHSFLPCDRDFGIIKRKLRKQDRLFTVHEITEEILKSSRPGKFIVKEVSATEILDFKSWWNAYYRKTRFSEETQN